MPFDNTYARLPHHFYQKIAPTPVAAPQLIRLNTPLAQTLELDLPETDQALAALFSGNTLLDGMEPLAQAYAGHQFGHFVPQLGDGRALLLGEAVTGEGHRFDIQLKGSGRTRFSRGGDGRSPLGPVIREYVVSEAMHALGIPTTRALAMVTTGETVHRETPLPGAVMTRVASSFLRVGTFEYFAARNNVDALRQLAEYAIQRHYPEAAEADNPYAAFFEAVCAAQAKLVAQWMCVGFIHGVMNTDNTTISGETIDFGPCAFMDSYNPAQVFSSIDQQGRYAFNQQPLVVQWNMGCLGGCLVPLLSQDETEANAIGEQILGTLTPRFAEQYRKGLCAKVGLHTATDSDFALTRELLSLMHQDHVDFTVAFRTLCDCEDRADSFTSLFDAREAIAAWVEEWRSRLKAQGNNKAERRHAMRAVNPAFIPRNHRIEEAIRAAEDTGDFALTHRLIEILSNPFADQPENSAYQEPPQPSQRVHQTFCGT
ncbi:protein adenylyltransferase SelO [Pseudodesulfovibrio sediminis]|uniref:Protein nucleotidyltransferase YdiU n=1 Tax=Pseudodesulfovibrio sediminis TaxID=2810563 RepID=A0ABM8HY13_9BACT|nr:YdiU family protein [Pseudodesulfovibrio sediminis]BCS88552.1 UPF0061 protein [Pseudodesulfovibrio sediminis]